MTDAYATIKVLATTQPRRLIRLLVNQVQRPGEAARDPQAAAIGDRPLRQLGARSAGDDRAARRSAFRSRRCASRCIKRELLLEGAPGSPAGAGHRGGGGQAPGGLKSERTSHVTPFDRLGGESAGARAGRSLLRPDGPRARVCRLRALHPTALEGSRDKLFWYLCGWLGGPQPLHRALRPPDAARAPPAVCDRQCRARPVDGVHDAGVGRVRRRRRRWRRACATRSRAPPTGCATAPGEPRRRAALNARGGMFSPRTTAGRARNCLQHAVHV